MPPPNSSTRICLSFAGKQQQRSRKCKAEEEATPLLEAKALQPGEAPSMEALQKPERKLKETRTFNPRKMRPKR